MDQSARFSVPLASSRPRGSRLIEAFSPKLGRRLRCFGRHAFDQWIRLEADPKTLTFCERPLAVDHGDDKRIVDFWVRSRDDEALLIIGDECPMSQTMIGATSLPIRSVPLAELAAARVWIKVLRAALLPPQSFRITSPYLRFCTKCLRRGYHGVLHQLELLQQCPMHGGWLQTDCRRCGQPTPFRLNARLLDAPFRCGNCRAYYVSQQPSFLNRRELPLRARIALTQTRLRFAV